MFKTYEPKITPKEARKFLIKRKLSQIINLQSQILLISGHQPGKDKYSMVGLWDCAKSPFGLCAYDHYLDPVHDKCVFCGLPEERK